MRYKVIYKKPKKKGCYSKQEAVFLDIDSAFYWEQLIKTQGATEIEIMVS
jgi:hypothetical protein